MNFPTKQPHPCNKYPSQETDLGNGTPESSLTLFWSHYPSTLPKQVLLLSWFYIVAFPLYEFFLMESYGIYFFFGGWHMLKLWDLFLYI